MAAICTDCGFDVALIVFEYDRLCLTKCTLKRRAFPQAYAACYPAFVVFALRACLRV